MLVNVNVTSIPVITAPSSETFAVNKATGIPNVSLSESGSTSERDLHGHGERHQRQPVGDHLGHRPVSGSGHSLTISGTLSDVNATLATLSDTDPTVGPDTIHQAATDQFNNSTSGDVLVNVNATSIPVITAPSSETFAVNKATGIPNVSLSESGSTSSETFTVTVSDTNGNLSATTSGTDTVSGSGHSLTISGTLSDVNATLATLSDTDPTVGPDTIHLAATDQFNSSTSGDVLVNVNATSIPVITAPSSETFAVNKATGIPGVSLSESGSTSSETFTVTVSDTQATCRRPLTAPTR